MGVAVEDYRAGVERTVCVVYKMGVMETSYFSEVVLPEVRIRFTLSIFILSSRGERQLTVHNCDNDITRSCVELCTVDMDDLTGCKGDIRAFASNLAL